MANQSDPAPKRRLSHPSGGQPQPETQQRTLAHLLHIEPDIARFLPPAQRVEAEGLAVPLLILERGAIDVDSELRIARAFAAIVLEGMMVHRLRVGDQPGLRLLGPGDIVARSGSQRTLLLAESTYRVAATTEVAILGDEWLVATRRWPLLIPGLQTLLAAQSDRLSAQFVICQLPRVDQRLLTVLWLLAESWGHVTSVGTTLPLSLTHDVLGEMIGARRSTVTLALGELSERGAIVRQDVGWLLLEPPPAVAAKLPELEQPVLLTDVGSLWTGSRPVPDVAAASHAELRETVARLRKEHQTRVNRYEQGIERLASSRQRSRETRRRIAGEGISRRRAPSS
jgi:CRP/FNR family transcriptional regulator, cyclic AMP receptor protein